MTVACLIASHGGSPEDEEEGMFVCADDGVMKAVNKIMSGPTRDMLAVITAYKK